MSARFYQLVFKLSVLSLCALCTPGHSLPPDSDYPATPLARIDFITRILDSHPKFLQANLRYVANPLSLLEEGEALYRELKQPPAWMPAQVSQISVRYFAYPPGVNRRAIADFRDQEILAELSKFPLHEFRSLARDLQLLSARPDFERWLPLWLKIAPALYSANGIPAVRNLSRVRSKVEAVWQPEQRGEVEDLYLEYLPNHLAPLIQNAANKLPQRELIARAISDLVASPTLKSAVTPLEGQGEVHPRTIYLEEVPPGTALLRGAVGFDCSALSVPFHALSAGAKTYFVRQRGKDSADIFGYAFVVPAKVGEETLPYVITINGSRLGSEDTRAILKGIAHDWRAKEILLPNFKINPHLVNTQPIRSALSIPDAKPATVVLSPDWEQIDQHRKGTRLQNYYSASGIRNAHRVAVTSIPSRLVREDALTQNPVPSRYFNQQHVPILDRTTFERSLLAAHAFVTEYRLEEFQSADGRGDPRTDYREVDNPEARRINYTLQNALGLSRNQVMAAKALVQSSHYNVMDVSDFRELQAMGVKLETLPLETKSFAATITSLMHEDPALATPDEWNNAFSVSQTRLRREIDEAIERADFSELELLFHYALSLPKEHNPFHSEFAAYKTHPRLGVRASFRRADRSAKPDDLLWYLTYPFHACLNILESLRKF